MIGGEIASSPYHENDRHNSSRKGMRQGVACDKQFGWQSLTWRRKAWTSCSSELMAASSSVTSACIEDTYNKALNKQESRTFWWLIPSIRRRKTAFPAPLAQLWRPPFAFPFQSLMQALLRNSPHPPPAHTLDCVKQTLPSCPVPPYISNVSGAPKPSV